MKDLDRLHRAVDKAIRAMAGLAVMLTLVLLLVLASDALGWGQAALEDTLDTSGPANTQPWQPISERQIANVTRGKAIFRTSRVRKRKSIDELAHYQLVGTSVRNEKTKAYVRDTRLKKMLIKRIGEELGSYELIEISKGAVTLKRGSEEVVLRK